MDVLQNKILGALFRSRYYPLVPQIIFFLCFVALIYGGIVVPDVSPKMVNILRNTNLAALLVWSLWWPIIILSAIFFGRAWCQVCPMELVNSLLSKIGLRRKAPRFLKSGWVITLFYAVVLLVVIQTFWAHRYPRRMALYLILLFAVAIVMGLIYEKRAFCNYVCPVGHLLGLYSLCAALEWRAKDADVCARCKTKDCISPDNYYTILKRSCTSNLYPAAIKDNRRCLLCTQCLKVCPYGNLRFSFRKPLADFLKPLRISAAEFFFIYIVSAFVIHEIYVEWPKAQDVLFFVPARINAWMGLSGEPSYFVRSILLFLVLPGLIYLVPSALATIRSKLGLFDAAKKFSFFVLPVMAAAHFVKSLFKMTSRVPNYQYALSDPLGLRTAQLLASGQVRLDTAFVGAVSPFLTVATVAVFAGAYFFSLWLVHRASRWDESMNGTRFPFMLGLTLYSSIFLVMVFLWRF